MTLLVAITGWEVAPWVERFRRLLPDRRVVALAPMVKVVEPGLAALMVKADAPRVEVLPMAASTFWRSASAIDAWRVAGSGAVTSPAEAV